MINYIIRRIILFIPILLVVAVVVFSLIRLIPGDPAVVMLGEHATDAQIAALREQMGLNEPVLIQFGRWMLSAVSGDLGISIFYRVPVLSVIYLHAGATFSIVFLATIISLLIALPVGIICAVKRDTWVDSTLMGVAFLGVSMPSFWFGLMLILFFAVKMGWFPSSGYVPFSEGLLVGIRSILLPSIALGVTQVGVVARMLRFSLLDVLSQDYIRTAEAKGISGLRVLLAHAFPNTLIVLLTVIGTGFSLLMAGGVIVETIFNIQGLGQLTVNSVLRRDFPLVQGCVLSIALMYAVVNLMVDISYGFVDPRIRYE